MIDMKTYRKRRRLSVVPRWSVMPHIRRQSVAEHVFNVMQIVMLLIKVYDPPEHNPVTNHWLLAKLLEAMGHDDDEAVHGDPPSTSKTPKNYAAMSHGELVVKLADIAEAYVFCYEEVAMGNSLAIEVGLERRAEFLRAAEHLPVKKDFYWNNFLGELIEHTTNPRKMHPSMET